MGSASLIGGLSRRVPEGELKGTARLWYYLLTGKINRHQVTGERLPFTLRYRPVSRLMPMLTAAGYTCQVGGHAHTVLYAWHG